jgi:superfamily I DNA and/or RNA helicase
VRIIKNNEFEEGQKDIDYLRSIEDTFYADLCYIFLSNFPSEISTYNSLRLMIEEIEENKSFTNSALERLFGAVFSSKSEKIQEIEKFRLGDLEYYLPIYLSKKQKEGLENAIRYEVSYIQGPPGTGKSHVITALALLSILKGYKVLIVSQKAPAIKVLYEKLTEKLGKGDDYLPFIYYHDDYRGKLKEYISKLTSYNVHEYELLNLQTKLKNLEIRLNSSIEEYKRRLKQYKEILSLNHEFSDVRQSLARELEIFNKSFYEITKKLGLYSRNLNDSFFKANYRTFEVLENYGDTRLLRIRKKFLIREIKKIDKDVDSNLLMKKPLSDYLAKLKNVLVNYKKLTNIRSKIQTKTDPNELKEELEVRRKQIMEDAQEYLRLLNQKRIFENAREYLTDLNTFKQILHYQKVDRIKKAKDNVNWANLLEVFNIWIVDIPNVDRILPMEPELFDLVVVDESSQVNLAQVIPVFYRAKRICVVGDHKQLSLESTGLGFEISNKLDSYTWEKYKPANLSYEEAKEKRITLTKASILDFLRENNFGIPEVMLDEHFRSVPSLARFTNREFYENKLSIMTEKPEYELKSFKHIETGGDRRRNSKVVIEEVERVFEIIRSLLSSRSYQDVQLPDYVPEEFTVGIVCFTREQSEHIRIRLFEEGIGGRVYVGTPEELQGHEFDVVIISMALDKASNRSKNHYENKNRFNVATSRAKYFTFLVYGGLPENFDLTKRYIAHFSEEKPNVALEEDNLHFSRFNFESELEEFVYERCLVPLKEYFKQEYGVDIKIYNQYKTCGYRLDFVLYNKNNKKFVALEVDGPHHFEGDGLSNYADWHVERIEKLKRAGWNIINTPYYKWYLEGWLDQNHPTVKGELERIRKELEHYLL